MLTNDQWNVTNLWSCKKNQKDFQNWGGVLSLDEVIGDEELDEEEGNLHGLPNNNADATEIIEHGSNLTGLPEDKKLTDSRKEGVYIIRKDIQKD